MRNAIKKLIKAMFRALGFEIFRIRPISSVPLELLLHIPHLFREYRELNEHPSLERKLGGWVYEGEFYPDYLTVRGSMHYISREALKLCQGHGVDVGAGHWPLPGSIPIDNSVGPGFGRSVSDFEDGSLDYVFSSHCLEHIDDWNEALCEWIKKLKPGGIIFLYLPHPDYAIWHPGSPFVGDDHKWIPEPSIVKESIRGLGCEIIQYDDGPNLMGSFYVCGARGGVSP